MSKYVKYRPTTHRRLYAVWYGMKSRCTNKNHERYESYGGRGISVCGDWLNFEVFADWALNHGYNANAKYGECTLDRIDVNGNYEPSNCRFVSLKTQQRNRRNNVLYSFNGEEKTLSEWSEITGISYHALLKRLYLGWSIEDALTKPLQEHEVATREDESEGVCDGVEKIFYTPGELAKLMGIRNESVYNMIEQGEIPSIKIGTRFKVPKEKFHQWINETTDAETAERKANNELERANVG